MDELTALDNMGPTVIRMVLYFGSVLVPLYFVCYCISKYQEYKRKQMYRKFR